MSPVNRYLWPSSGAWTFFAFSVALLTGCSATGRRPEVRQAASPGAIGPAGAIFVANGAGDFGSLSQSLAAVLEKTGTPLEIKEVEWSLGYRRYVADQVDHDNHLSQGRQLASELAAYRASYPGRRIYLIGHSAGCAVLLAAADLLPPDGVDRIILLAPSVCRTYDLRPALRSARCGIDLFYSERDRWILGLGMKLFGTTDRDCREAAGRHGFMAIGQSPTDAALYGARLRQHPWNPAFEWSGHNGGHFGNNEPEFLRAYVLPLFTCN